MLQTHETAEKMCAKSQKKEKKWLCEFVRWADSELLVYASECCFSLFGWEAFLRLRIYDSSRSSACVFFIFGIMTTFGWPLIPTRIHRPAFSAFYTNAWNENRNNKSRYDTALDSFLFLLQPNDCLFVLNDSCAILCSRFRVFCVVREKRPSLTNRERQRTLKKNCCQHIPAPINWAPISKLQIERFFSAT